jgi:hypothetical protein
MKHIILSLIGALSLSHFAYSQEAFVGKYRVKEDYRKVLEQFSQNRDSVPIEKMEEIRRQLDQAYAYKGFKRSDFNVTDDVWNLLYVTALANNVCANKDDADAMFLFNLYAGEVRVLQGVSKKPFFDRLQKKVDQCVEVAEVVNPAVSENGKKVLNENSTSQDQKKIGQKKAE